MILAEQEEIEEFQFDSADLSKGALIQEELDKAIDVENYELAAKLRDKLNSLNSAGEENN